MNTASFKIIRISWPFELVENRKYQFFSQWQKRFTAPIEQNILERIVRQKECVNPTKWNHDECAMYIFITTSKIYEEIPVA